MKPRPSSAPSALLALCCALAAWLSLATAPAAPNHMPPGAAASIRAGVQPPVPSSRPAPHPKKAAQSAEEPSFAIYPPQKLPLRFDHRKHVKQLGMACTACHDAAPRSKLSRDRLLPPATRCDGCHGTDHRNLVRVSADASEPLSACANCHVGYTPEAGGRVAPVQLPAPNLKFNHALHVGRGMGCADCHGNVGEVGLATRAQLPRMQSCLSCHRLSNSSSQRPSGACATCHVTDGTRLVTQFPSGSLEPPAWLNDAAHDADWLRRHASVAGNDSRFCANCHTERSCASCHDGRVRPRDVHPNDFLSMHPLAARQNSASCTSCHRQQSFCISCHQRSGVTASGPFGNFSQRGRFHPPRAVWSEGTRGPGHHAWEAQRNLNACVSCHVERECAGCHATSEMGGLPSGQRADIGRGLSPHSSGFRSRCARALRQNARPCLVCHSAGDASLAECR